jgi:nitroimidazol reductase NimA-like FMN-containing flavoprotein (pyridoxamine 5'-phosphate oxidase superfamily)
MASIHAGDPVGMEELGESECYRRLETHRLGRVVIIADGRAEIFPVNYAVHDHLIAFRTAPGTKLVPEVMWAAAFEIDGVDSGTGVGWSVIAHGIAHDVTEADTPTAQVARRLLVRPMAPGPKTHLVAIEPVEVSGRRFHQHG